MSCHQKAGHNQDIKTVNKSFGNMMEVRYVGKTKTNENCIHEEIKLR
jgi:hypothetical protein